MDNINKLPLEAYKILAELLRHDDNLFWRRNEVMLVINGGMLTVLGWFLRSSSSKAISLAICVIGFVMSILWLLIVKRSEAFYNHWYEQLKFLEKHYLAPVNIFQIADQYFATGQIKLGEETFKLDFLSRRMRMFQAMQVASLVLAIIWLALGIYVFF